MKALTILQPWASLVAYGIKTIETRPRHINHRGPIAIHAAKAEQSEEAAIVALPEIHDALWPAMGFTSRPMPASVRERLPRGAIVASANLVDCVPIDPQVGHEDEEYDPPDDHFYTTIDGRALYRQQVVGDPSVSSNVVSTDLTDQLPFGDFRPGRYAWLLDDIKPTTERCPACWGSGYWAPPEIVAALDGGWPICPVCDEAGHCAPIPARGRQATPWEWTP